jgi:hypothetical protein
MHTAASPPWPGLACRCEGARRAVRRVLDEVTCRRAQVIGLTAAGRNRRSSTASSTCGAGLTVGVIAMTRRRGSAAARWGDRAHAPGADDGVFVPYCRTRRPAPGRSCIRLDGAYATVYDRVVVESVGVGQSEAEITLVAIRRLACSPLGRRHAFMKARWGNFHIAVVTKADQGVLSGVRWRRWRAQPRHAGRCELGGPRLRSAARRWRRNARRAPRPISAAGPDGLRPAAARSRPRRG